MQYDKVRIIYYYMQRSNTIKVYTKRDVYNAHTYIIDKFSIF